MKSNVNIVYDVFSAFVKRSGALLSHFVTMDLISKVVDCLKAGMVLMAAVVYKKLLIKKET